MLEEQEAWKREGVFDGIEIIAKIIAEIHAQTLRHLHVVGFDSERHYTGLYNLRWLSTSEKYTLEINVEVNIETEIFLFGTTTTAVAI